MRDYEARGTRDRRDAGAPSPWPFAVDHRGDDLTGMSFVLAAHHDDVTVTDRCVDHRLTTHPKSETPCQSRRAREEAQAPRRRAPSARIGAPAAMSPTTGTRHRIRRRLFLRAYEERPHVQLPSHGRSPTEEALLFETLEVLGHRRRRAQTNRVLRSAVCSACTRWQPRDPGWSSESAAGGAAGRRRRGHRTCRDRRNRSRRES